MCAAPSAHAQTPDNQRISEWPDGSPRERYAVDDQERKHGTHEAWAENGTRILQATYSHGVRNGPYREWGEDGQPICLLQFRNGELHGSSKTFHPNGNPASSGSYQRGQRKGAWTDFDTTGSRKRVANYKNGVLNGSLRVEIDNRVVTKQTWKQGILVKLDGLQPFPVAKEALLKDLRAILTTKVKLNPDDPKSKLRHAALLRLRAYRQLCGLRHADMELRDEWNDLCDAAAEVCRNNGKIDHFPPQPAGFDDDRYQQGALGARKSNLAIGGTVVDSVDNYMDDSDPSNIDRVGHRRWCLNPMMKRTAFGTDGRFHAMWSMDASGKNSKGLPGVYYPPRGWVPVDFFGSHHAFSIGLTRGGTPSKDDLRANIRPLDADFVAGDPLEIDTLHTAPAGYGTGACIIFRAKGLKVAPGRSYLVEVSTDSGKTYDHRYLIAFCDPVGAVK